MAMPRLYIATYTNDDGRCVWQTHRMGMPVQAVTTEENARTAYAKHRLDFFRWQDGEKVLELPETPPIWDGDKGTYR